MKDIKNSSVGIVSAIHSLTFTVFFIVETILSEFFYPWLNDNTPKGVAIFVTAVIAAILYSLVYFIVKLIYNFILLKKEPKLKIDGTWYHVHIPHTMNCSYDYSYNEISCGKTKVSRNFYDFTFVGDNKKYYVKNGSVVSKMGDATHWYTKATKLSDENDFDIIEIYEAKTNGQLRKKLKSCPCCKTEFENPIEIQEAEKFRHGIHKIDIVMDGKKVESMKAEYIDCWPSHKHGSLLFFKTKEEMEACVKEYFEGKEQFEKEQQNNN